MITAIDLTSLNDNFTGLERYALMVTTELIKLLKNEQFVLVFKGELPERFAYLKENENVSIALIKNKGKLVTNQLILPLSMKRIKADRYYFPAFPVPLLFKHKNTTGMIADTVCFDMPYTMKLKARLFWGEGLKHTAKVSRSIVVISKFTGERVVKYFPKSASKAVLGYCGIDREGFRADLFARREEVREKYSLPEQYYLSVSTIEPRKNLKLLLMAYDELISEGKRLPKLVLTGRKGWKTEGWFYELTERLKDHVIFTGFAEEEDLPYIYAGAEAFIFPSLYEGFGMPPFEASASGVLRILVSDIPVMREVMGDTALYFKDNDLKALKEAIMSLPEIGEGHLAGKSGGADENLKRFNWKNTAWEIARAWEADI